MYGVRYMMGTPWDFKFTSITPGDEIWDYLVQHIQARRDIVTASANEGRDTTTDKWGIVLGHGYSILGAIQLRDGTRLVRARNPWGFDSYMGEYGSESP